MIVTSVELPYISFCDLDPFSKGLTVTDHIDIFHRYMVSVVVVVVVVVVV